MSYILGISCYYHDAAASLIKDGQIVAAVQEERFTRKKNDQSFPKAAIEYCLNEAGIEAKDLTLVAFYDKPLTKFERILETYLTTTPLGLRSYLLAMSSWLKEKLFIRSEIAEKLNIDEDKIIFPEHHESHAASAFFPSPFKQAAFLTMDGVGEWTTTSFGVGSGNKITMQGELRFPHSLGLLYSAFTYYLGFKINDGEYKVMGLAPYGEPKYKNLILKELIDLKEDGSLKLNLKYFNFLGGLTMTNSRFHNLLGGEPLPQGAKVSQREMDLAASVQAICEQAVLQMARHVKKTTGQNNLCLAGGVALNSVANGKLLKEKIFDNIWIQPAAGDSGASLGAAIFTWYQYLNNSREADGVSDQMQNAYLGPKYSEQEVEKFLQEKNIAYTKLEVDQIAAKTAQLLANENVVGWFQGRMEFGPRALGSRSILGDARSPKMQSTLNLKIKFRESFRPFAPVVTEERAKDYFDIDVPSPYMLMVVPVQIGHRREMSQEEKQKFGIDRLNVVRSDIPAVTHVDYSARLQSIKRENNQRYYDVIKEFEKLTGCAVIINTSFNVNKEPIVCTPQDAYNCFMNTNMDYLVMDRFLLTKVPV